MRLPKDEKMSKESIMEVIQNQFPESQFEKLNKIANEIDGSITANELSIWINELKNVQTD